MFGVADVADDPVQVAGFIRGGRDGLFGDVPVGVALLIREFPFFGEGDDRCGFGRDASPRGREHEPAVRIAGDRPATIMDSMMMHITKTCEIVEHVCAAIATVFDVM